MYFCLNKPSKKLYKNDSENKYIEYVFSFVSIDEKYDFRIKYIIPIIKKIKNNELRKSEYEYYLIYKTTNKITGKSYVGQHCTNNINDKYIGSGTMLLDSIKKHGKDNFDVEILEKCSSIEELNLKEIYWIKEVNTLVPNGYNLTLTRYNSSLRGDPWNKGKKITQTSGEGNGMYGKTPYEIWLEKYGKEIADKKLEEWKSKIKKTTKEKCNNTKFKKRVSKNSSNRIHIKNEILGISKMCKPKELEKYLSSGWEKGRLEKHKLNMRENSKGKIAWNKGKTDI